MIKRAMTYIADELKLAIGLNKGNVILDSFLSLKEKKSRGIIISLLNVEEEPSLKNGLGELSPGSLSPQELVLNIKIIIVFNFEDYGKGLEHLSSVAGYLHKKPVFSAEEVLPENPFPPGLSTFSLSLCSLDIATLNRVWAICGGIHYPALFYKLRLLHLAKDEKPQAPEINTNRIIGDPLSINRKSSTDFNLK